MLVVSPSSQGTCAFTMVGETSVSGAAIPLRYTWVPPSVAGSAVWVRSADAVWNERLVPITETMVPGATEEASPPPRKLDPLAAELISGVVAVEAGVMVLKNVILLPLMPGRREVRSRTPVVTSGVA